MAGSDKAANAVNTQETAEVFLAVAKIEAGTLDPVYLVDDTQPVTHGGVQYIPSAFELTLPSQSNDGGVRACTISLDNVDRSISELVTRAIGTDIIITFEIILASTPDITERGPFRFILRNVEIDQSTVRGELYDFYLMDRKVPRFTYTQKQFRGIYS
jgi:hypothetical protein